MTKLKRCPCCNSDDIGPSFSFLAEDDSAGITIRCGNCGLMLTPVEHPTDEDGDIYDEDSDYVEEVLDDLAYDWNKRAKDSNIDSFVLLGKEILDQIDKYANKVHGVEQIRRVDLLRKRIKELEEIHNLEVKDGLVQAKHDTGSQVLNGQPYVIGFDPAQTQDVRPTLPDLGGISASDVGTTDQPRGSVAHGGSSD